MVNKLFIESGHMVREVTLAYTKPDDNRKKQVMYLEKLAEAVSVSKAKDISWLLSDAATLVGVHSRVARAIVGYELLIADEDEKRNLRLGLSEMNNLWVAVRAKRTIWARNTWDEIDRNSLEIISDSGVYTEDPMWQTFLANILHQLGI